MGRSGTLAGRLRRLGWGGLAAGAAALVMTACGSQLASSTGAAQSARPAQPAGGSPAAGGGAAPGGLCSDVPAVTRLTVHRADGVPGNHLRFAFPDTVAVTSPAQARAVARAVCTLPPMPHGAMSCPIDQGVSYRLDFAASRDSFPRITVAAGGCGAVSGAGPVRQAGSARFWTLLGHALGIRQAAASALRGTSPGG